MSSDAAATNPRQNVTFPSNGGQAYGYLALPESGRGPGLVVIQEWWGLTDHIVDVCDRLAAEGFVALAPDLFGGRTTHDADEAGTLMAELPVDQAARDLSGAVDFLVTHGAVTGNAVGTVGFCMGGGFVLQLAALAGDKVKAAVPYYGVFKQQPDLTGIRAAVQGHYGEQDAFYPAEQARTLEKQLREEPGVSEVEFFYYPAGHAFHNDENLIGTYQPAEAQQAWRRTVDFLRRTLG